MRRSISICVKCYYSAFRPDLHSQSPHGGGAGRSSKVCVCVWGGIGSNGGGGIVSKGGGNWPKVVVLFLVQGDKCVCVGGGGQMILWPTTFESEGAMAPVTPPFPTPLHGIYVLLRLSGQKQNVPVSIHVGSVVSGSSGGRLYP